MINSQRFKKNTYLLRYEPFKKFFKFFIKHTAGRNNQGKITLFSKSFKKKTATTNMYFKPWDNRTFINCNIFRNKKKLYGLNKHIGGSISIQPYINGVSIGQHMFVSNLPQKFWKNTLPGNFIILRFLPKHSVFSNILLYGYKKYATANGTFCQVIEHFFDYKLVRVSLPSKTTKIVSALCFVILGRNSQIDHKYNKLAKAGVRILLGSKPKSRGVARNPVDHPHGGRTKTNQPEVSIWGWVAKRNK